MQKLRTVFVLIVCGLLISCASSNLAWFHSRGDVFSVQAPPNWIHDKASRYLSVYSPDGRVTLHVMAYKKKKGVSFSKFSKEIFNSVQAGYLPVGEVHKIKDGLVRGYEVSYPGETRSSYDLVAAIDRKNYYIYASALMDRREFMLNKKVYLHMFETVTINHKK